MSDEEDLADYVITEGRMFGSVNILLTTPLDELSLEKAGVALNLVCSRGNIGRVN
jgi:hypothetical protein